MFKIINFNRVVFLRKHQDLTALLSVSCKDLHFVVFLLLLKIFILNSDWLIAIRRATHKAGAGNHQNIFDTVMPLFAYSVKINQLDLILKFASLAFVSFYSLFFLFLSQT